MLLNVRAHTSTCTLLFLWWEKKSFSSSSSSSNRCYISHDIMFLSFFSAQSSSFLHNPFAINEISNPRISLHIYTLVVRFSIIRTTACIINALSYFIVEAKSSSSWLLLLRPLSVTFNNNNNNDNIFVILHCHRPSLEWGLHEQNMIMLCRGGLFWCDGKTPPNVVSEAASSVLSTAAALQKLAFCSHAYIFFHWYRV